MNVTLSIIISAYNAEVCLAECLDSVLVSTYRDFEILLVNDGSQDHTGTICDCYARNNSQIRVFHTLNRGLPSARNLGLENAKGKYVAFVDADDVVSSKMFAALVSAMETGVQMAVCGFRRCQREAVDVQVDPGESLAFFNRRDTADRILNGPYASYVWNKLYCKSVLDKYCIRFNPDAQGCEDLFFNAAYVQYCERSAFADAKMYNYVANPLSIMETFRRNRWVNCQYVSLPRANRYAATIMQDIDPCLAILTQARAVMYYQTVLRKLENPSEGYIAEAVDYVRKHKNVLLRYRWGYKYYLSAIVLCAGYHLWSKVFRRVCA